MASGFLRRSAQHTHLAAALAVLGLILGQGQNPAGAAMEPDRVRLAQADGTQTPRVRVAPLIPAGVSSQTPLRIEVAPATAVPRDSFLRLSGLPPELSVSGGHAVAPGVWAVPLSSLTELRLHVPAGATGRSQITIMLMGRDGTLLAKTTTTLAIGPEAAPSGGSVAGVRTPPMTPQDRELALQFVERGEQQLGAGNVALAREFFRRAARGGSARAALLLGATYDPGELARLRVPGVQPDVAKARRWYEAAHELGATEAEERLGRLAGR